MEEYFEVRRVVVAFDASHETSRSSRLAARIARRIGAQLTGLFVEDERLLALGRHPLAREIDLRTGAAAPLESSTLRRQMRAVSRRAERALAEACQSCRVEWSFELASGSTRETLAQATGRDDLVVFDEELRAVTSVYRPRRRRRALDIAGAELLLARRGHETPRAPAVLYDGSTAARRALRATQAIAADADRPTTVLLLTEDPDEAGRWRRQLDAEGGARLYRRVPRADRGAIGRMLDSLRCDLLGAPIGPDTALGREELEAILEAHDGALLVVH
jgi:nucleotide-binding universal stress UspA family protein